MCVASCGQGGQGCIRAAPLCWSVERECRRAAAAPPFSADPSGACIGYGVQSKHAWVQIQGMAGARRTMCHRVPGLLLYTMLAVKRGCFRGACCPEPHLSSALIIYPYYGGMLFLAALIIYPYRTFTTADHRDHLPRAREVTASLRCAHVEA